MGKIDRQISQTLVSSKISMTDPILIDAHQDLAWNILTFGRDYTLSAAETRKRELGTLVPQVNGDTLLGWPDYQRGKVAVIFSTLFATPTRHKMGEWDTAMLWIR